ncbi:hypothetical protein GGR52DRAFT_276428 [Hypoxylon sp. FL1284]|nr:hypothetical protein GGR52DRAFT_276428 [Hypoxylon sp. FL1284]
MRSSLIPIVSAAITTVYAADPFENVGSYGLDIIGGSTLEDNRNADKDILDISRNAQQNPNATRGVAFKPFDKIDLTNTGLASGDVEWTWRVNVSEFADPKAIGIQPVADPHIVTTSYDFTWPGGGSLDKALNDSMAGLCVTAMTLPSLPQNVSDKYNSDAANSASCAPVLGQACVDAILGQGATEAGQPLGRCQGSSVSWFSFPECQDTLGYALSLTGSGTVETASFGFHNVESNKTHERSSGEGWFGRFSAAQNGSGSALYYNTTSLLQVAMVNPVLPIKGASNSTPPAQGAQLLCTRVNVTEATDDSENADDPDEDSAGSSVGEGAGWTVFMMSLVSFTFMVIA